MRLLIFAPLLVLALSACAQSDAERDGWFSPEWSVDPSPILHIGNGTVETEQFGNVRGAAWLSDGSIAVADVSSNDIRMFNANGAYQYTLGREGRGPAEFREIWGVLVGAGDTIWGFDQPAWKLVGFREAIFQREARLDRAWPLRVVGGTVIATVVPRSSGGERSQGLHRAPMRVIVHRDGVSDTIARVLDEELYLNSERNWQTPLLQRNPYIAVGSDFVAVADGGSPVLSIIGFGGDTLRTLSIPSVQGERRNLLIEARRLARLAAAAPEDRARAEALIRKLPLAEHFADISGLAVDAEDHIWIRPAHMPRDSTPVWHVYSRDGEPSASIRIPQRLRIREISSSSLLVTERGEYDVPLVAVYRLRR